MDVTLLDSYGKPTIPLTYFHHPIMLTSDQANLLCQDPTKHDYNDNN